MSYWTTQQGEEIEYEDLKDSHLLNILKFIENKAKVGHYICNGGGYDADEMWFEEDTIYGEEVLNLMDYKGLTLEAQKRKLI